MPAGAPIIVGGGLGGAARHTGLPPERRVHVRLTARRRRQRRLTIIRKNPAVVESRDRRATRARTVLHSTYEGMNGAALPVDRVEDRGSQGRHEVHEPAAGLRASASKAAENLLASALTVSEGWRLTYEARMSPEGKRMAGDTPTKPHLTAWPPRRLAQYAF